MQVAAYGGLSAATKRRLREIAIAISNGDRTGVFSGVQIKPGKPPRKRPMALGTSLPAVCLCVRRQPGNALDQLVA